MNMSKKKNCGESEGSHLSIFMYHKRVVEMTRFFEEIEK